MSNPFNAIKAWYLRVFLPFENPSHPLHAANTSGYVHKVLEEISDFVDTEVATWDNDKVGPNYYRQMGDKPAEYIQWGDKWYRRGW